MASSQSQWYLLPTELLETISKKIAVDIADFARFRSVCRSWRYAAKPQNLSPQLPWLLLPYDPNSSCRSFYSLSTRSIYTLDLPETRKHNICGSSNGWFLMFDKALNISLFNPFTRSLIRLPPINNFPSKFRSQFVRTHDGYADTYTREVMALEKMDDYNCFNFTAFITPHPNSANMVDGVVIFMVLGDPEIQYWRPGDAAWTTTVKLISDLFYIRPITFYKDKLYFVYNDESTPYCACSFAICDLGPQERATMIPCLKLPPANCRRHLVELPSEELLMITYYYRSSADSGDDMHIDCYKLIESEGMMTWSQIEGVGDCSVFLTKELMPIACDVPGSNGNCLYYLNPDRNQSPRTNVCTIEDGRQQRRLQVPWEAPLVNMMKPSWIAPSLC